MDYKQYFKLFEEQTNFARERDLKVTFEIEHLYQAFKQRMLTEMKEENERR